MLYGYSVFCLKKTISQLKLDYSYFVFDRAKELKCINLMVLNHDNQEADSFSVLMVFTLRCFIYCSFSALFFQTT